MRIQDQLKAFEKTEKFNKLVTMQSKTSSHLISSTKEVAIKYGEIMRDILRNEILVIRNRDGEAFLDYITVKEDYVANVGWVVNVSFDEEKMQRNSLYPEKYPDGVDLNVIFNEDYNANDYVYGVDRHGSRIRSSTSLSEAHRKTTYFIQRAVKRFNSKYISKAIARYNNKYSGGDL